MPTPTPHVLLHSSLPTPKPKQHSPSGDENTPQLLTLLNESINTNTYHTKPLPAQPTPPCSNCHHNPNQGTKPAQWFVSKNYTNWDTQTPNTTPYHTQHTYWWCEPCTWAHTTPALRKTTLLITHTKNTNTTTFTSNLHTITATLLKPPPLPTQWALSHPHNTTKHTLPHTQWEHITTKTGTTPWTVKEQETLHLLTQINTITPHTHTQLKNLPHTFHPPHKKNLTPQKIHQLYTLYEKLKKLNPHVNPQHDTITHLAYLTQKPIHSKP